VRSIEQYVRFHEKLGAREFQREYGRPALIGVGMVGELSEHRGRTGTLKMAPVTGTLPAKSLVGRVWLITKGPGGPPGPAVTGGRAASNDLVIPEYTVSNHHFHFRYDAMRILLSDLGSLNGTFVDDRKLAPNEKAPLRDGARVVFGRYQFEFMTASTFLRTVSDLL
jgi:hypothetical protein